MRSHYFGRRPYQDMWQAMRQRQRQSDVTRDHTIWYGEHPATYTLGQAGDPAHLLTPHTHIPVIHSDRGGQITYHGPGQLMFYTLFNLKALGWGVRTLVCTLEQTLIDYLASRNIEAHGQRDAPGVYIQHAKLASVGLRITHAHSYHGMAINVGMDLSPFAHINPCGYPQLRMTQLSEHGIHTTCQQLGQDLSHILAKKMGETVAFAAWKQS